MVLAPAKVVVKLPILILLSPTEWKTVQNLDSTLSPVNAHATGSIAVGGEIWKFVDACLC